MSRYAPSWRRSRTNASSVRSAASSPAAAALSSPCATPAASRRARLVPEPAPHRRVLSFVLRERAVVAHHDAHLYVTTFCRRASLPRGSSAGPPRRRTSRREFSRCRSGSSASTISPESTARAADSPPRGPTGGSPSPSDSPPPLGSRATVRIICQHATAIAKTHPRTTRRRAPREPSGGRPSWSPRTRARREQVAIARASGAGAHRRRGEGRRGRRRGRRRGGALGPARGGGVGGIKLAPRGACVAAKGSGSSPRRTSCIEGVMSSRWSSARRGSCVRETGG